MTTALHILLIVLALWLISGSVLNITKSPHWYVRVWDFGRLYVAAIALMVLVPYAIWFRQQWYDWLLLAGLVFVIVRQIYLVFPYTPIAPKTVRWTDQPPRDEALRLFISNVQQENDRHELWMNVARAADADVIVAAEINQSWDEALSPLERDYPYVVRQVQNNYYGMSLYSRLELIEREVRFLVQDDVPSIHVTLRLRDGTRVRLHALHPRPPQADNDQSSAPRDAELVLMGREVDRHERLVPAIVCGDLNDVAWSYTTRLFLRISKLLDPRMGRGMYNSFKADSRIWRFPLDHVFHSDEFKLIDLRVCDFVGSDHFPILIALSAQPQEARRQQSETREQDGDRAQAREILEEQAQRERSGEEHGHVDRRTGAGQGSTRE